ncbi:hypothetical protein DERF_009313 [Dermatophagoides farinae]|uniref:Uncharacterized protein n=2 Tax=Dermatophagoides farinae TaxID=6954 RepID=A0A922HXP0_DERFA|nr:hypothetical protein DERF_009313 [Dermatophagoides farinae]
MERIRAAKNVTKNMDITNIRNVTYAAIFTFLTMFCNTIAFSTPNWLAADGRQPIKRFNKLGLWEACFHQFRDPYYLFEREFRGCKWIFDEDYAFMIDFLEPVIMTITNGYRSDYDYGHDDTDDTMDRADGIGWGIIRKRKRMSDARIVAIAATTITAISAFIAFFSQYWLASERRLYGAKFVRLGLWATCFRSYVSPEDYEMSKYYAGCRWIFAEEYQNIKHILMPGFFIATQALYTIGFVFLLMACICVLAIQLCFIIEKEILAMKLLSSVMFLSALFTTLAVIIFGIRGDDRDWMPDHEHNFLSWSFGFAVVGAFFSWMASAMFWAESRILFKKELKKRQEIYNMEGNKHVHHHHHHQQQ